MHGGNIWYDLNLFPNFLPTRRAIHQYFSFFISDTFLMKEALYLIIGLIGFNGFSTGIIGQDVTADKEEILAEIYPEGVYLTYTDLVEKTPSNTNRIEARDVFKPKKKLVEGQLDNCLFYSRRKNKRIKDAFAIVYYGQVFINVNHMKGMMDKKERKKLIDHKDSYLRVLDLGKYWYMEGFSRKGGGLGLSIGGGPVSVGTGGPREELRGILFDPDVQHFDMITDCKDFNEFLQFTHPERAFKCPKKSVPITLVRDIVFKINDSYNTQ